jgi:C4-dicarboxylate-specific signal transduction histidine kinase
MLTKEDQKEAAGEILGLMQKSVARMSALIDNVLERPILVRATTSEGKFELSVANAGEPIPSEATERLFQPFYRLAEQARSEA